MVNRKVDEKLVREMRALKKKGLSYREISEQVGRSVGVVHKYCTDLDADSEWGNFSLRNEPVDTPVDLRDKDGGETRILSPEKPKTLAEMAELFGIDTTQWVAETIRTNEWYGFYKSKATGHHRVPLWQTRVTWRRIVAAKIQEGIQDFIRKNLPSRPPLFSRKAVPVGGEPQMVCWGLWDAHIGMYAWSEEVGENFDLTMATHRVLNSIDDMVRELGLYKVSKVLMPIGNDFMHFDNAQQRTTSNMHSLDTDTRFAKVYAACLRCLIHMVDRALEITDDVEVLYVPGNHDQMTSYTLCVALQQHFRLDKRVKVDAGANPRKYRKHGGVILGFDHGNDCKAERLAQIFANECRLDWSSSTYQEVQIGHTHQRREQMFENLTPTNGVTIRTNPSLCNIDAWHHKLGFIGEPMKSVEAYRYDEKGYRGSHVVWARDESNPAFGKPLI